MEIQGIFFKQMLNNIIHKIPYNTNTFIFEMAMLFIETHNRILYIMQKYGEPRQFNVNPFTLDETEHTFPEYGDTAYVSPAVSPQPSGMQTADTPLVQTADTPPVQTADTSLVQTTDTSPALSPEPCKPSVMQKVKIVMT